MAGPLLAAERERHAEEMTRTFREVSEREKAVATAQADLQATVNQRAKEISDRAVSVARQGMQRESDQRIAEERDARQRTESRLVEMTSKLTEAQSAQAEAVKAKRELDDARRELELTVERRVSEQGAVIRAQAVRDAENTLSLKVTERDETITQLTAQINDLRLAAESGSARVQGEAQEIELEQELRLKFPMDTIEAVGKWADGADVIQKVVGLEVLAGKQCGVVVWESKRTKNWNEGWLAKLRQDQREAKAEIAILVSRALPEEIETFALREGVWVVAPRHAMTLAFLLRRAMIEVTIAREVTAGQATKAELLYRYLTGPQFKHRVTAVIEKITELRDDLDKERKSLTKQWAKREQGLEVMVTALAGMYGDVQGLAGQSMKELEGLRLPEGKEAA